MRETVHSTASVASRPNDGPASNVWRATGLEPQVFFDRNGRRARRISAAGLAASLIGAGWLVGIVGGSAGFASLPALRPLPFEAQLELKVASHHSQARRHRPHAVEVAELAHDRG